jgi:hypothetical protein
MDGLLRYQSSEAVLSYSQYVDGGIGVSVKHKATTETPMCSHRQGLLGKVSTPTTHLRRVRRIDRDDQTTSTFSLIRQDGTEHRPRSIRNRLGKAMILRGYWGNHAFHIEFFDGNDAKPIDQPPCGLVNKIMATVPDTLVDTRDYFLGFSALSGAANLFSECPLRFRQRFLVFAKEARVISQIPPHECCGLTSSSIAYAEGRRRN